MIITTQDSREDVRVNRPSTNDSVYDCTDRVLSVAISLEGLWGVHQSFFFHISSTTS